MPPISALLPVVFSLLLPVQAPQSPLGSLLLSPRQTASKPKPKPKPPKTKPAPKSAPAPEVKWRELFDGKTLGDWKRTEFGGGGEVHIEQKFHGDLPAIVVEAGATLSGFNWTGEAPPKTNYELSLEAMKIAGGDFFCGATFPVGEESVSLILGGWGGSTVGISSVNHLDASENETTKYLSFMKDHWFKIRIRVVPNKIEAWLDDKQIIDLTTTGKKMSLRFGDISRSLPLGFATYDTSAAYRSIKIRPLDPKTGK